MSLNLGTCGTSNIESATHPLPVNLPVAVSREGIDSTPSQSRGANATQARSDLKDSASTALNPKRKQRIEHAWAANLQGTSIRRDGRFCFRLLSHCQHQVSFWLRSLTATSRKRSLFHWTRGCALILSWSRAYRQTPSISEIDGIRCPMNWSLT